MTAAACTLWLTGGALTLAAIAHGDMTLLLAGGCVWAAGCLAWVWEYL